MNDKKITVNRGIDYASFALHGLGYAGLFAAVTMVVASPVISALAFGVTAAINLGLVPALMRSFAKALPAAERGQRTTDEAALADENQQKFKNLEDISRTTNQLRRSPRDRRAMDDVDRAIQHVLLYGKNDPQKTAGNHSKLNEAFTKNAAYSRDLGLRVVPTVHYLQNDAGSYLEYEYGRTRRSGTIGGALLREFNKHANAAAFSYDTDNVILSKPLVEHLEKNEINAVLGHELGHIAARHGFRRRLMSYLSAPASLTAGIFSIVTTFSSIKNFGLVVAGGVAGYYAAQGYAWVRGLDEENKKDKAEIARLRPIFQRAAVMGLGAAFMAPDLVFAQGLALATGEAGTLIGRSYSRRNEYQADRIAAELTRDPMALVTGLDKVRKYNITLEKGMDATPVKKRQGLGVVFSRIQELYRTHPTNERRHAALEKMALAMETPAP